jgi:hypothetical protein
VDEDTIEKVARAVGARPVRWIDARDRGFTGNERWVVELEHGRRAFVKRAVDDMTAGWLRAEHRVYDGVRRSFLPDFLGWDDDGDRPLLVLEDLTDGFWPPPWSEDAIQAVLRALDAIHATSPPTGLPSLEDERENLSGWHQVADEPEPFLSLGLCTREWLDDALTALLSASDACVLAGDSLVHCDVRSDNVCIRGDRAVLVDWNWACTGNPAFDLASWAPSLAMEGGPQPEELLPHGTGEAAIVSGFFAARAGLPPPPDEPGAPTGQWTRIRVIQLAQLGTALPWAARALGLPPPEHSR